MVQEIDRDVDVPLFVDRGREALLELQPVGVFLWAEELRQES